MKKIFAIHTLLLSILINGCTPIPTGGGVSANVIYVLQNKSTTIDASVVDSFTVDMNHDSIPDFRIVSTNFGAYAATAIVPLNNMELVHIIGAYSYMLKPFNFVAPNNEPINASNNWVPDSTDLYFGGGFEGRQMNVTVTSPDNTFVLGVRIKTGTDYHYGWIRMTIDFTGDIDPTVLIGSKTTLIETAYNKTANQQILAGKK